MNLVEFCRKQNILVEAYSPIAHGEALKNQKEGQILLANAPLMRLMFGRVEEDVMEACVTYLRISAYSYPALAIYNSGAALYRSMGKTITTMYISVTANMTWIFRIDVGLQKKILRIAVPNGVAQSIWSMASLVCIAMGPVFITVIGQCMGAGDISQAEMYFRKLTKIILTFGII